MVKMSSSNEVSESTQDLTHRFRYMPPHLRSAERPPISYGSESTQLRRRGGFPSRGRGRGRRGPGGVSDLSRKLGGLELSPAEKDDGNEGGAAIDFDAYEDIPVEVSGEDVPPPASTFAEMEMSLGERLSENVRRCGYVRPTPVQRNAIPIALAGRDLMACAQTGSGKTAAFCFPIISGIVKSHSFLTRSQTQNQSECCYPTALVLSPTRELACQIHDEAKKFAHQTGVKIMAAYGGASLYHQFRGLERGVDFLVATPGRLTDMVNRGRVSLRLVKYLTLDEADRMLDMGFEPQIRKIVQGMDMPLPGARQTMLFSATFPSEIQRMASEFLSNYIFLAVGRVGSSTGLIAQRVDFVEEIEKRSHLMHMLHAQKAEGKSGKHALTLVFVETKKGADALEYCLYMNGFPAIAIHGDKVQIERERALRSFKTGETPIMVATDVASRGLDIPLVSHVINFDLPRDIDDYVHRIGRTGRAGKSGRATAFFSEKNTPIANSLAQLMAESNQEVPQWLDEYAKIPSSSSSSRGQSYRGTKFGGHDYRNASSGSENFYNSGSSAPNHDPNIGYDVSSSAPKFDTNSDYEPSPNVAEQHYGFGEGYGTVVATGWD